MRHIYTEAERMVYIKKLENKIKEQQKTVDQVVRAAGLLIGLYVLSESTTKYYIPTIAQGLSVVTALVLAKKFWRYGK